MVDTLFGRQPWGHLWVYYFVEITNMAQSILVYLFMNYDSMSPSVLLAVAFVVIIAVPLLLLFFAITPRRYTL